MGLLYEYSSNKDFAYDHQPAPEPLPDVPPDEANAPEVIDDAHAPADEFPFKGGDIALSTLVIVGVFFLTAFGLAIVFAVVLLSQNPALLEANDPFIAAESLAAQYEDAVFLQFLIASIVTSAALGGGALYIAYRTNWDWAAIGVRPIMPGRVLYAAAMGTIGAAALVGGALSVDSTVSEDGLNAVGQVQALIDASSPGVIIPAVVLGIFLLPLGEELFFRGVLFAWLRYHRGWIYGAILSALIYAALAPKPVGFLPTVVVGVGTALVYQRTDSIWGAYAAHCAFNGATVLFYWLILAFN
jgi:uncharacterized protein